jgi:hypothetical protein
MDQLARRWNDLLLADVEPGETLTRAVRASGSVLREPATEQQVLAVESRLGRRLPPSYREFLLVSDGAYADLDSATRVYSSGGWEPALSQTSVIGAGFLPCADLRWLRDVNDWQADMYADTAEDEVDGSGDLPLVDGEGRWPWTPMAAGLVIAVERGHGTTCLVPVDGSEEWQVWDIAKETSEVYRSFRSMLEFQVEVRTPVPTIGEARDVIERARAGDGAAKRRIAWITAPEAVPLLLEIGRGYHQMLGLGRIGTDEAVDALGRERWVFAERALVIVGSERAQDILASWGAVRALAVLDRRRATDLAAAMLSGHWPLPDHDRIGVYTVLGESGDPAHVEALLAQRFEESELWEEFAGMAALARLGAYEGRQRLVELAAGDGYAMWSAKHTLMLLDEGYLA